MIISREGPINIEQVLLLLAAQFVSVSLTSSNIPSSYTQLNYFR